MIDRFNHRSEHPFCTRRCSDRKSFVKTLLVRFDEAGNLRPEKRKACIPAQPNGRCVLPAAALLMALLVGGCTVGPDYQKPQPAMPAEWSAAVDNDAFKGTLEIVRWWDTFGDPQLQDLVTRAVSANKDLKMAEARVRAARALWRAAGTGAWPTVDVAGSYKGVRQSENAPSAKGQEWDLFQAGFDAGWEIDLFGGTRRAVEAAQARVEASEENRRDVLVTLVAEVATNYVTVRGSQRRLAIALENIGTQNNTVALTLGRFEAGLGNKLDVVQSQALLASTEAKVPVIEASIRQAIHRLGVLLGLEPEALLKELLSPMDIPHVPPEVPVGLPSDLLRRRPDIRGAERQLAAATANIGVATADLFPHFSLSGLVGLQSTAASDLFTSPSRFWTFGPTVRWPVFDAGKVRAAIQVETARQEEALAFYEKAVLTALEEVESAMVAYAKGRAENEALMRAVEATRQSADIAFELYQKGLVDFLNVLQSQLALYQVQDQFVQSRQHVSTSLVVLFKALGGGWEVEPPGATAPASPGAIAATSGKK
jgi:NodT family efflux transporter outer membrane factor (OMF) lipoprotein